MELLGGGLLGNKLNDMALEKEMWPPREEKKSEKYKFAKIGKYKYLCF